MKDEQRKRNSEAKKAFYATQEGRDAIERGRAKKTGRVQSEEEWAMRSHALKGKRCGGEWTEERRAAHSLALKGKKMPPMSDETRKAISEGLRKRNPWVEIELPNWIEMRKEGMSILKISKITGRSWDVISSALARSDTRNKSAD